MIKQNHINYKNHSPKIRGILRKRALYKMRCLFCFRRQRNIHIPFCCICTQKLERLVSVKEWRKHYILKDIESRKYQAVDLLAKYEKVHFKP